MEIRYTRHIKRRIWQRGLIPEQIEQAVAKPDYSRETHRGRCLARKDFYGKILEVVYKKTAEEIVLITAYFLQERS